MVYDKVVNSVQLDGAMTATANAIRKKNGSTTPITWEPTSGFESAIDKLETGGGNTLAWNEDTVGRRVVKKPNSSTTSYYRISGEVPTLEELQGGVVYSQIFDDGRIYTLTSFDKVEMNGALNYLTVTEHQDVLHINYVTEKVAKNVQPYYIIATKNNAYDSNLKTTFPEIGIYCVYFGGSNVVVEKSVRKLTIFGYTKFSAVLPPMEEITVTPSAVEQNLTPQEGYQGFMSVKVEPKLGGNAIKWDGNREDKDVLFNQYYRVSDIAIPLADDNKYYMLVNWGGEEDIFELTDLEYITENVYAFTYPVESQIIPVVIFAIQDTDIGGTILKTGTYFGYVDNGGDSDMYVAACAVMGSAALPDTLPLLQSIYLTPDENTEPYIMPDEGYDGLSRVIFAEGGTLVPENIREGVTILGVTGTYTGE